MSQNYEDSWSQIYGVRENQIQNNYCRTYDEIINGRSYALFDSNDEHEEITFPSWFIESCYEI